MRDLKLQLVMEQIYLEEKLFFFNPKDYQLELQVAVKKKVYIAGGYQAPLKGISSRKKYYTHTLRKTGRHTAHNNYVLVKQDLWDVWRV